MEEKYSFKEKQKVIYHMIKKKLYKEHISHLYQNIEILDTSEFCFNCWQKSNNNIYCSKLCKNIFESNLYKNSVSINCVPISLLNLKSRKKIINVINWSKENIVYDKIHIYYKYCTNNLEYNTFKKIYLTISFIHKYKKIYVERLELDINVFKTDSIISKTFINNLDIPSIIDSNLPKNCLCCNKLINKPTYTYLSNNYILGRFCSIFCNKIYLSIFEQHTRQPYKYFINLPPLYILKDRTIIENFKKKKIQYIILCIIIIK